MRYSVPKHAAWIYAMCLLAFALMQLSLSAQAEGQASKIQGVLQRVAGTGGESTGWAIRLDKEIVIAGKTQSSIEVAGRLEQFSSLENKHIEASGMIVMRHGIERGEWPVLEITEVHEIR